MPISVNASAISVDSLFDDKGNLMVKTDKGYKLASSLNITPSPSPTTLATTLAGERPTIGDGVQAVIHASTPYVTIAGTGTTKLKRSQSANGSLGNTVTGFWFWPSNADATATLVDGTGLNGVFNHNILPAGFTVGKPVWVDMKDIASQDGGWSIVTLNCPGFGLGNLS